MIINASIDAPKKRPRPTILIACAAGMPSHRRQKTSSGPLGGGSLGFRVLILPRRCPPDGRGGNAKTGKKKSPSKEHKHVARRPSRRERWAGHNFTPRGPRAAQRCRKSQPPPNHQQVVCCLSFHVLFAHHLSDTLSLTPQGQERRPVIALRVHTHRVQYQRLRAGGARRVAERVASFAPKAAAGVRRCRGRPHGVA